MLVSCMVFCKLLALSEPLLSLSEPLLSSLEALTESLGQVLSKWSSLCSTWDSNGCLEWETFFFKKANFHQVFTLYSVHVLTHLILKISQRGWYYYCHFVCGETEAHSSEASTYLVA